MNDTHIKSVRGRFSAAAGTYEVLATAQSMAASHLLDTIPADADGSRILEIGCGTGLLTAHLLKRFPETRLDAIDVSDRMIAQARARFSDDPRIRWFAADMRAFKPRDPYPLIVSNSSLHWLPHLQEGLRHLAGLLTPSGRLIFAIMLYGTLGELHETRARVIPHKPPLRRLPRADEVMTAVATAGLRLVDSQVEDYKASYRGAAAFLRSLHDQGLTGGELSRSMLPLTRGELRALTEEYDHRFALEPGHVYATYRVLFIHALKPVGA